MLHNGGLSGLRAAWVSGSRKIRKCVGRELHHGRFAWMLPSEV